VLASFAVNNQFANLERLLQAGFRADLYGAPLSQNDCMGFGSGKAAGGKQQNNDEYAKRAHGSPIIWLCTKRAEICPHAASGVLGKLITAIFPLGIVSMKREKALLRADLAVTTPNDWRCRILILSIRNNSQ
jgi:hypothetical protein